MSQDRRLISVMLALAAGRHQPGKWVVRFHLDMQCLDLSPESPHGHAAFYVEVP